MSESLVDLSYRGLNLGKRIKLTQIRPSTGFLEMPMPMPVGTSIGIAVEDGVQLEATVTAVHEQVTGSDRTPGMLVRPKLDADEAHAWWTKHVSLPELETLAPHADAGGKVTVVGRRDTSPPQLVDDGRSTAVMDVVEDAQSTQPTEPRRTNPGMTAERARHDTDPSIEVPENPMLIVDDGKRTIAMSAIDLAALGLDAASSSGAIPAATDEEETDPSADEVTAGGTKKKKKRRR